MKQHLPEVRNVAQCFVPFLCIRKTIFYNSGRNHFLNFDLSLKPHPEGIGINNANIYLIKTKNMFTLDQIKAAHAKVKSGADFPAYIRDLKQLGVESYHTYVSDGHTEYFGSGETLTSAQKYDLLTISEHSDKSGFAIHLKEHQQGKTNYMEFCQMCADTGVEKWTVALKEMTCTYYDLHGHSILVEGIPA
jgi:uncharacterized protein YbcV (DUF1398 family)